MLALSLGPALALAGCSSDPGGAGGSADAERIPSVSRPSPPTPPAPAAPAAVTADERPAATSAARPTEHAARRNGPSSAATSDLHPSELLHLVDMPRVEIGQPARETLFDLASLPGAAPDPEADSVQRGRRHVEPIEAELSGAYDTPEELAQVVLDGISIGDAGLLLDQRVTKREFEQIFWPEFPQSRPATNIQVRDAWVFHDAECHDGVKEALHRWGGTDLRLRTIRWEKGIAQYANFNLYHGAVLEAVTDRGELVEIEIAPLLAERNGRWKVYMYAS